MILTSYLYFHFAILNNVTCIVSCGMLPMVPLDDSGIDCVCMNIKRVGYTRLESSLAFCHLCMTAVHEAKWLASTKKAGPWQPCPAFLTNFCDYRFEEV